MAEPRGHGRGKVPSLDTMPLLFDPHPEVSLDPHPSYPKVPPKLWTLLSDGSHRS